MNIEEAYKILDIEPSISDEDLRKKFKKLAAKYHPDINKEPDADKKSKEISEAFNLIKNYRGNPPQEFSSSNFGGNPFQNINMNDFFSNFMNINFDNGRTSNVRPPDIEENINLSFIESVTNTKKTLEIKRTIPCQKCDGNKKIPSDNVCKNCDGRGFISSKEKIGPNSIRESRRVCEVCHGSRADLIDCDSCNKTGVEESIDILNINIPNGIPSGKKLKYARTGHFNSDSGRYSDIILTINVEEEKELSISELNILSEINISLEEAINGVSKEIKTIKGPKKIKIPALKSSKCVIRLSKFGVGYQGDHLVTVIVNWDSESLKKYFEKSKEENDTKV